MQKLTDDLLEKFLSGNCSKEEAATVWNYLRNNPDEQYLLNEYEQTNGEAILPSGYKDEMLAFITAKTGIADVTQEESELVEMKTDDKKRIGRRLWHWAAAAAVIVLFKGWFSLQPVIRASGEKLAIYNAPAVLWVEKNNTGKKDMLLTLPDSSKVRLSPGAHMRYRKDFGGTAPREVRLTGKAFFDVAKNEKLPFTLYSEGLRTRVLGTSFDVNANPYSDKIKIRLITGKVMVTLDEVSAHGPKDYYLTPGQELVFSKSTRNVAINATEKHTDDHIAKAHPLKADTISNWYMFNNQTLAEVFDQLSAIYNVEIEYSRDDIRNMYFIGKLEKKDSLSEIISDIALLNHLSVTSLNGKYIIKKGKP